MSRNDRRHPEAPHVASQVAAAWANLDAANRAGNLSKVLASQDRAFLAAMQEVQAARDFVGTPESILGSSETKHGEIAEQVNVAISRARDILFGNVPSTTFEGVGRFAPIDYISDGVGVQSKYYNGLQNTLRGVSEHATKYPEFSGNEGIYDIPSDQFQQFEQLAQTGNIDGLSERSANAIRSRLDSLEQQTGKSADELLRPGDANYSEVQQGRVHDTISDREAELTRGNEDMKDAATADHGPTLSGLGQAAAIGAAAGGGIAITQAMWVKYREGKNPFRGDFTLDDWQDVGVQAAQGAGGGSVAGAAVYLVTNSANLSAPAAGAFVSALMGIGSLLRQHHAGKIDGGEFVDMSQIVAVDAAIVGIASMTGQVLFPVPLLGAFIGIIAGKFVTSAITDYLGETESELIAQLQAFEQTALLRLDGAHRAHVQRLNAYFGNLERLAEVAFDSDVNTSLRLAASIRFAEAVGVPDNVILRTTHDLDQFMTE